VTSVLRAVLKAIQDSGMVSLSEISAKIGSTAPMVEAAIAILQSKGYIERVDVARDAVVSCAGCHNHCRAKQWAGGYVFYLTEKGKKSLN